MITLWMGLAASAAAPEVDTPPITGASAPDDFAVVIANQAYTGFGPVPYAARDADAFAAWLVRTRGLKPLNVVRADDESRAGIRAAVEDAARKVGAGGTLWVYYAGHGLGLALAGRTAPEQVLLGINAIAKAEELPEYVVPVADLQRIAAGSPAAHVVFVLDACFNNAGRDGAPLVEGRFAVPAGVLPPATNVTVWSATDTDQTALPYPPAEHGAFTYFVVGALSGWADGVADAPDGRVTLDEAAAWVARALPAAGIRGQTPRLAGDTALDAVDAPGKLAASPQGFPRVGAAAPEGDDYIARLAAAQAEQQRLAAEHGARVDATVARLQAEAAAEWERARPVLDGGGDAAREVARTFVTRWDGRTETVDGEAVPVPIVQVADAKRALGEGGGFLGVLIGAEEGGGVRVLDVTAGSPAAEAGIEKHDVLSHVGDAAVDAPEQLVAAVGRFGPGDTVKVTGTRNDKARRWTVTLGARPDPSAPLPPGGLPTAHFLQARAHADDRIPDLGYTLRGVSPGSFEGLGGRDAKGDRAHPVTLTRGFLLGTAEVTELDWRRLEPQTPRQRALGSEAPLPAVSWPATHVSWCDAVRFSNLVSAATELTPAYRGVERCEASAGRSVKWDRDADGYRLPTEAEWEYAARRTLPAAIWLDDPGMIYPKAPGTDRPAATLAEVGTGDPDGPNQDWFGLSGNVAELTWDGFGPLGPDPATDPTGAPRAKQRTLRTSTNGGGLWRGPVDVTARPEHQGLRLARNLPDGLVPKPDQPYYAPATVPDPGPPD